MAHFTIELSQHDIETFADIRMKMIALYGPYMWRDLLIALVEDHLDGVCADVRQFNRQHTDELPGWLLRQRRRLGLAPLRGVMKDGKP